MASKFNVDFLRNNSSPTTQANGETLSKFKNTKEIFEKADNMIDSLSIDKLIPFKDHPFKIRDGERLDELTQSIKEQGILVPLIVRVHPEVRGSYEILAGHHRRVAAERAGVYNIPAIIKNVDDNTAVLIVVESNRQRGFSDMLPSEIAKALKLEYDALKCQGKRTDLMIKLDEIMNLENIINNDVNEKSTECPVGTKHDSAVIVGEKNDLSRRSTYRYIRLNNLIPPLLDLVDDETIAIRPAVDLSFLKEGEQYTIADVLDTSDYKMDMKKAEKLKEYSRENKLNVDTARLIISGEIFNVKEKKVTSVNLSMKKIQSFMPTALTVDKYGEYIVEALEFYKENRGNHDE